MAKSRFTIYMRRCQRCSRLFKTKTRTRPSICERCKLPNGAKGHNMNAHRLHFKSIKGILNKGRLIR